MASIAHVELMGLRLLVLMAAAKDQFRKPQTSMVDYMLQHLNQGMVMDVKSSFYVGDAAGRDVRCAPFVDFSSPCHCRSWPCFTGG